MMKNNDKRKGNNAKKILPAAGMLALSASMLATSTYAWFTMSREVEVKNIQLTATTPEDIQLSLGQLGLVAGTADTDASLTASTGFLATDSTNKAAQDPGDVIQYWSNSADISAYYQFGRLIPASSTTGATVVYTPDASGEGKTVKDTAKYYATTDSAAIHAYTATPDANTNTLVGGKWADGTAYTVSTGYDSTNDDGYFVDIPVWFRTSSTAGAKLTVTGFVTDGTGANTDTDDLYKAARVAILNEDKSVDGGVIDLQDVNAFTAITYDTTNTDQLKITNNASAKTVFDSLNYNNRTNGASGVNALFGEGTSNAGAWGAITQNYGQTPVIDLTANTNKGTGSAYGAGKLYYIRVWLEGEDGNCWNENAAQDWAISLKFAKYEAPAQNP